MESSNFAIRSLPGSRWGEEGGVRFDAPSGSPIAVDPYQLPRSGVSVFNYLMFRNSASGPEIGLPAPFQPDSNRESLNIGPPASLRPVGGPILKVSRPESGRNPARKPDFRPHRVSSPKHTASDSIQQTEGIQCGGTPKARHIRSKALPRPRRSML